MIRFIRDPQPPYTQFKAGMTRELGATLEALFVGTGDAVASAGRAPFSGDHSIQPILVSDLVTSPGGNGVKGVRGVLYQTEDEAPSRLFYWDGEKHVATSAVSGAGISTTLRTTAPEVMATPPTVAVAAANQIADPQKWGAIVHSGTSTAVASPSAFTLLKGAGFRQQGTGYPDYFYMVADTITVNTAPGYDSLEFAVGFILTGSRFVVECKGMPTSLLVQIDGKYVSLAPTVTTGDGTANFVLYTLSALNTYTVILCGYNFKFANIYTDKGASITPITLTDEYTPVGWLGDSYGESSGNEISSMLSMPFYFAEARGLKNIINSSLGSTGLIAAPAPKPNYVGRVVRDLVQRGVKRLIVAPSFNDRGETAAAVVAAAEYLVSVVRAAGYADNITFTSPVCNVGVGWQLPTVIQQNKGLAAWAKAKGIKYLNTLEMPLQPGITKHTSVLTAPAAGGATQIQVPSELIAGATYEFADGTAFVCKDAGSGTVPNVDRISVAQASGSVITQRGPSLFTGGGNSSAPTGWGSADSLADGTSHLLNAGYRLYGRTLAQLDVAA